MPAPSWKDARRPFSLMAGGRSRISSTTPWRGCFVCSDTTFSAFECFRSGAARHIVPGLSILGLAFLLTFSPHAVTSLRDGWKTFSARYQERAIFAPPNRPEAFARAGLHYDPAWQHESLPQSLARHPLAWGRVLFTQTRDSLEVLYRNSDPTAFYNIREHRGSMLSPVLASLTLLGLVYAAAKALDPRFGLLSLWFWGGLLGPALTLDTP